MNASKLKSYAPSVLRIGMSLIFLWFGYQQIFHTAMWTAVVPDFAVNLSHLSATTLVLFNGSFEIIFGLALIFGIYTRIVSFLLALHMIHIMFTVGYNSIGVRDFGLAIAAITVFLNGVDVCTLDAKWKRGKVESGTNPGITLTKY